MGSPAKFNKLTETFLTNIARLMMDKLASGGEKKNRLAELNELAQMFRPRYFGIVESADPNYIIGNTYGCKNSDWRMLKEWADENGIPSGYGSSSDFADYSYVTELPGPIPKEYSLEFDIDKLPDVLLDNPEYLEKAANDWIDANKNNFFIDQDRYRTAKDNYKNWSAPREAIQADPMMYADGNYPFWMKDYAKKLINGED